MLASGHDYLHAKGIAQTKGLDPLPTPEGVWHYLPDAARAVPRQEQGLHSRRFESAVRVSAL